MQRRVGVMVSFCPVPNFSMSSNTKVDLSTYRRGEYDPGPLIKRVLWYFVSLIWFESAIPWPQGFKRMVLKSFGARLGDGIVLKPSVKIKFPWKLSIGDHCWIGEEVWIDNLAEVVIGDHACLSQGACIMTGNHDRTSTSFDLRIRPVEIGDGAWLGAKSLLAPQTRMETNAVLQCGAVANGVLEADGIYAGNPAQRIGTRVIS